MKYRRKRGDIQQTYNSFLASDDLSHLLITFATDSLYRGSVGPNLDPNRLTL